MKAKQEELRKHFEKLDGTKPKRRAKEYTANDNVGSMFYVNWLENKILQSQSQEVEEINWKEIRKNILRSV